jgi:hypothetical protein
MQLKVDTTTVDSITHLGVYAITIKAASPVNALEMTTLDFTITILEPCDPPQLTVTITQPATITIMRLVTASQTVDVSTSFASTPKDFTECPYTYTPTIDADVQSAFTYDTATKVITLDTITTDTIDHLGNWDIVIAPTTPFTGTVISDTLTLSVTVLEPCDVPQMSFFASSLTNAPISHERQFDNTEIDIVN